MDLIKRLLQKHTVNSKNIFISSVFLKKKVRLTLIFPVPFEKNAPVVFFNDGQDFPALNMENILNKLWQTNTIRKAMIVGIHTDYDRNQMYGTAHQLDYRGEGRMATNYQKFFLEELIPFIEHRFKTNPNSSHRFIAGFSLGGLSAFETAWNNPNVFSKVGVFSGSFWWRSKGYDEGYNEQTDRIAHAFVKKNSYKTGLKFWFECGTEDEWHDRNQNSIIDSIDDTIDLILLLQQKGYILGKDIIYVEIPNGRHNQETWKSIMPTFLSWAIPEHSHHQ